MCRGQLGQEHVGVDFGSWTCRSAGLPGTCGLRAPESVEGGPWGPLLPACQGTVLTVGPGRSLLPRDWDVTQRRGLNPVSASSKLCNLGQVT